MIIGDESTYGCCPEFKWEVGYVLNKPFSPARSRLALYPAGKMWAMFLSYIRHKEKQTARSLLTITF
jgi:hypothetical protein